MIYQIVDNSGNFIFICPDQSTIDNGKEKGHTGIFIIGTEVTAQEKLSIEQEKCLKELGALFTVNKRVSLPGVTVPVWQSCDINSEDANTTKQYEVFDAVTGTYTECSGTESAKTELSRSKHDYLSFRLLTTVENFEEFDFIEQIQQ